MEDKTEQLEKRIAALELRVNRLEGNSANTVTISLDAANPSVRYFPANEPACNINGTGTYCPVCGDITKCPSRKPAPVAEQQGWISDEEIAREIVVTFITNPHPGRAAAIDRRIKRAFADGAIWMRSKLFPAPPPVEDNK